LNFFKVNIFLQTKLFTVQCALRSRGVFNVRIDYRQNNWKNIACLLRNHQSRKRVHLGKELECQLAKEDDLQSKSLSREMALRIFFNSITNYHRNNWKLIACLLRISRFQRIYIGQNLQCPLANEDDLQLKTVIKRICS